MKLMRCSPAATMLPIAPDYDSSEAQTTQHAQLKSNDDTAWSVMREHLPAITRCIRYGDGQWQLDVLHRPCKCANGRADATAVLGVGEDVAF